MPWIVLMLLKFLLSWDKNGWQGLRWIMNNSWTSQHKTKLYLSLWNYKISYKRIKLAKIFISLYFKDYFMKEFLCPNPGLTNFSLNICFFCTYNYLEQNKTKQILLFLYFVILIHSNSSLHDCVSKIYICLICKFRSKQRHMFQL